jgi:hypothetical protein
MVNPAPQVILDGRGLAESDRAAAIARAWQILPPAWRSRGLWLQGTTVAAAQRVTPWPAIALPDLPQTLDHLHPDRVGYIPLGPAGPTRPLPAPSQVLASPVPLLAAWVPAPTFPPVTAHMAPEPITSWIATTALVQAVLTQLPIDQPWSLLALAEALEQRATPFRWQVVTATTGADKPQRSDTLPPGGTGVKPPSVLAIVPHYRCEPWLHRCLNSLVNQTRPPDGIVVVDDGSPTPPTAIVSAFPTVSLWAAAATVGPYRLVQQVINTTDYDYYLFQDADDWSSCDRIAQLLFTAEQTPADLVGSQEIRVETYPDVLQAVNYPLDVNAALAEQPGHPLLHPTSLVRRSLVMALGGFATGLRFGGDTEFLLRATLVGRVVNRPDYGYFRQKRPHSLTTDPQTGLESPARQALLTTLKQRARANQAARRQGRLPDLTPLAQAAEVPLHYHSGPPLRLMQKTP